MINLTQKSVGGSRKKANNVRSSSKVVPDQEEFARCNRIRDSPIFYMRRRLNGKDGKKYGERNREYRDGGGRVSLEMNAARRKKRS